MKLWSLIVTTLMVACSQAQDKTVQVPQTSELSSNASVCSDIWYQQIANTVITTDAQQHGPDIGSDEWKSVIEFKLGVRGNSDVPKRDSNAWCQYIDQLIAGKQALQKQVNPSFDCKAVRTGSMESLICANNSLAKLDNQLTDTYQQALIKTDQQGNKRLKTEQRGWIKGRNECWKAVNKEQCIENAYITRAAQLQAQYRLVSQQGPFHYNCNNDPTNEVVITYFNTQPKTLIAERGDSSSLMFVIESATGTKYKGRNESFWLQSQQATLVWGYQAPALSCQKIAKSH